VLLLLETSGKWLVSRLLELLLLLLLRGLLLSHYWWFWRCCWGRVRPAQQEVSHSLSQLAGSCEEARQETAGAEDVQGCQGFVAGR